MIEVYTNEVGHHGDVRLNQMVVVALPSGNKAYARVKRIVAGDQGGAMITVRFETTGKVNHYPAGRVSSISNDILAAR